jgi:hypothetical protein
MHKRVDPKPQAQGAAPRVPSFLSIDFVGLYLVICVDETFVLTQIGASPASGRAKQEDDAIRAAHTPPGHMFMNEGIEASVPLALTLNVCMNVRFWEHIQTKLLFGRTMSHVPTMAARFILLFSKPRAASAFPSNPELEVTLPPTISSAAGSNRPRVQRSGGSQRIYPSLFSWRFLILAMARFVLVGSCQLAHMEWVLPMPGSSQLGASGSAATFSRQPTASSQFKAHLYMLSIQSIDHFNRFATCFYPGSFFVSARARRYESRPRHKCARVHPIPLPT